MKLYTQTQVTKYVIDKVRCNSCGRLIDQDGFGIVADYLSVDKCWGYGSTLDGSHHCFDLCEDCYKKIISAFSIPPAENEPLTNKT